MADHYSVERRQDERGRVRWVVISPSGLTNQILPTRKKAVAEADSLNRYLGRVTGRSPVTVVRYPNRQTFEAKHDKDPIV